jgi:branched-chain amino acid transport system ATP-binding protein
MLEVRGVWAGYGSFGVLENVSLSVGEGEFVGLVGRNGVGKTTLLKTIAGPVKPSRGEILWGGAALARLDTVDTVRAGIALVLDRKGIFASLTVAQNLALAARLLGRRRQTWKVEDMYDMFPRLAQRRDAPGGGLSGGEQQMLAIARALLCQPDLLLLDEPTEGLAPKIVDEVVGLLLRLRQSGMSAIVVDQRLDTVFDTCSEVCVMSRGNIVVRSRSEDLRTHSALLTEHLGV